MSNPQALAFDGSGNLYVANAGNGTVSKFAPGGATPIATLTGLNSPSDLAFDASGNLYVANDTANTVSEFTPVPGAATAGGVVIRSSLPARPMSLGGTNNAVNGIDLTDAELAQIETTSSGTVTFGDSSQTGNITCTTATLATTAGAAAAIVQSTSGGGQIILDDGAGTAIALNGNGGPLRLAAGAGGIVAAAANTAGPADLGGATTTSLVSGGPLGTSSQPLQLGATNLDSNTAANNSRQFLKGTAAVTIDAAGLNAGRGTVELDGGTFTPGTSSTINSSTQLDVNGATLALGTTSQTVNTLTLASGSITGSGGVLTSTNTIQTESGAAGAILAGSNGLTQTTGGTTTLSAADTFRGTTTVGGGTLALAAPSGAASTNNIAGSSTIDVQAGATLDVTGLTGGTLVLAGGQTLEGAGTVSGATTAASGSIVSPGKGYTPGILNTGGITFANGSTFSVALDGATAGTQYAQDNVNGAVTVNGGNLIVTLGYVPAVGDSLVIINNNGGAGVKVTNPFMVGGVAVPEGGTFTAGGAGFRLTYAGGPSGNNVVLTVTSYTALTPVVADGLEFQPVSGSFSQSGSVYTSTAGVNVGFVPSGGQPFAPLATLGGTTTIDTSAGLLSSGAVTAVLSGTSIPLLPQGFSDASIAQLTGTGVSGFVGVEPDRGRQHLHPQFDRLPAQQRSGTAGDRVAGFAGAAQRSDGRRERRELCRHRPDRGQPDGRRHRADDLVHRRRRDVQHHATHRRIHGGHGHVYAHRHGQRHAGRHGCVQRTDRRRQYQRPGGHRRHAHQPGHDGQFELYRVQCDGQLHRSGIDLHRRHQHLQHDRRRLGGHRRHGRWT